ncbi:MAG: DUF1638 domain-containing protein [Actinobacteria bacterium]|uniref:Unannotated protein n=1 Tax=freshwater metagenome TaxID=449393 RepID=A0A6J5ZKI8_9ZZZZ|nr:DUF1638 domain-containing protein [Actinomycetota bacterium]
MSAGVVACGALAGHVSDIADRRGLDIEVIAINPLLHNTPKNIPQEVERSVAELKLQHEIVVVAYADCGTYGALDKVCEQAGVQRLTGSHCYDVFATEKRMSQEFEREPGTYVLTDFLVRTFKTSVVEQLGLDRYPDLRDDYFHAYRRVVWLTQERTDELDQMAQEAAAIMQLPLEILPVGDVHLEEQLLTLLGEA